MVGAVLAVPGGHRRDLAEQEPDGVEHMGPVGREQVPPAVGLESRLPLAGGGLGDDRGEQGRLDTRAQVAERYQALNERARPSRSAMNRRTYRTPSSWRFIAPTCSVSPVRSTSSTRSSASGTVAVRGFSTSTCRPAPSAADASAWWNRSGAVTITASTDASAQTDRWSVETAATP